VAAHLHFGEKREPQKTAHHFPMKRPQEMVGKPLLISGVDARLHSGELRFAADLTEAHALADELKDFRRHLTSAGRATYQARTGKHDDLVLAVAIALWWAGERRKYRTLVGPVMGLI
jgi:hypothetical protein